MEKEIFINLIGDALSLIKQEYYMVTTTYRPLGIVRERVFCYELYHRMRCLQEKRKLDEIHIHGEIDKSGHDLFRDAPQNPDFIFHVPGTMKKNWIVVEVKGNITGQYKEAVFKDIQTLSKFTNSCHNYRLGILLLYNYSLDDFKQLLNEYLSEKIKNSGISISQILVLCKKDYNTPLECEYLSAISK